MTRRRKKCQVWVDPAFRKLLKQEAVKRDKSILDLTKDIGLKDLMDEERKQGKRVGIHFRRIL